MYDGILGMLWYPDNEYVQIVKWEFFARSTVIWLMISKHFGGVTLSIQSHYEGVRQVDYIVGGQLYDLPGSIDLPGLKYFCWRLEILVLIADYSTFQS